MKKSLPLLLVIAFALNGCAMSKSARSQRAYAKYVRNSSIVRQKQRSKFHGEKPQMPTTPMPSEPSDPVQTTETGPQAVTSGDSSG